MVVSCLILIFISWKECNVCRNFKQNLIIDSKWSKPDETVHRWQIQHWSFKRLINKNWNLWFAVGMEMERIGDILKMMDNEVNSAVRRFKQFQIIKWFIYFAQKADRMKILNCLFQRYLFNIIADVCFIH